MSRFRALSVLPVLSVVVLLAGCSDGDGDTASPDQDDATTTTTAPTTAAPTCERPIEPGRTGRTLQVDGASRSYLLYVPESYDGTEAVDLYLNLHGSTSGAEEQLDGSRLEEVADEHGFLIAAPEAGIATASATGGSGTGGQWNVPGSVLIDGSTAEQGAQDDVAFIEAIVAELTGELCVDHVYATGTSGGGRMSSALACRSELFDGVAPVAGLRLPEGCAPAHGVEVVAFHGTADNVNGYLGGGLPSWGTQTVPEAAAGWAALQQCSEGPTAEQVSASVSLQRWTGCRDGVSVSLYTVDGGGHTWPGGVDASEMYPELASVVGVTTQEVDAGQLMWEHFSGA